MSERAANAILLSALLFLATFFFCAGVGIATLTHAPVCP